MTGCQLCLHKRITKHYYEDNKIWIADCSKCGTPMLVIKEHDRMPSPGERAQLLKLCERIFGCPVNFRGYMRSITHHYHEHILFV